MKKLNLYKTVFLLAMVCYVSACKKLDLAPVNKFTDVNY